jgi:ABC transport system ATP-binding/permease protein
MQKLFKRRHERRPDTATAAAPSPRPTAKTGALQAHQLQLTSDGRQLLADVSFTAEPGTLTAVIGPSVASKTALIDVLGGAMRASVGTVTFEGHDVQAEHMRSSIGMVPRYDLIHPQLTIEQALGYAAEFRLPPGTSADHRRQIVHWALNELSLNSLRTIQVRNLSAEQRNRASIAMELLTGPSLLVLDEPPEGMAMLRRFADEGRVVVVATSELTDLDMCDQVLLLTAAGTPAFAGPPDQIGDALETTDWQEIFAKVTTDPDGAHAAFLARQQETSPAEGPTEEPAQSAVEPAAGTPKLRPWRQIAIAARRQAWVMLGDQRYFIFLTILPVLFGALALVVPGHAGLGPADPFGNSPDEAVEILGVLNIGAVVMGTALAIRDLSAEKRIFRREQANGLSASAYLAAKIIVYSVVAIVQTAIITTVAVAGKGAPTHGAALLGNAAFELFLALAVTAIVTAIVTMALASLADYAQQLLLIAVLTTLVSLMFAGALFPVAGRFGLEQLSWLVPARWGFAASASTVDVPAVNSLASSDKSWTHSAGWWAFDMAILIGFGVVATAALRWRLRPDQSVHRE